MASPSSTSSIPRALDSAIIDLRVDLFRPAASPVSSVSSLRRVFEKRRSLLIFLRHQG
ncbi:MAG: hypothetical protein AAF488_15705 [Planctomycetota bacterium]